jgi:hypothetical protein
VYPKRSANTTDSARTIDSSVHRYTEPPRRKSFHRSFGRLFLRFSRMYSDTSYNAYAYQYGRGASELPAGGSPIEGSTAFQEMPESFPRETVFELEQPDIQKWIGNHYSTSASYAQTAPEHLKEYYKSNQNATLRRPAPVSITNLPQLPRLEVPCSSDRVPRLMADQSSVTPSPISPITPVLDANTEPCQHSNSQLYLETVSPCTISKEARLYPNYTTRGYYVLNTPAKAPAVSPVSSTHTATPLSAHPSSSHSSFDAWPQLRPEQLLPTYSQTYLPTNYDLNMSHAMPAQMTAWQGIVDSQLHRYYDPSSIAEVQAPHTYTLMSNGQPNRLLHQHPSMSEKSRKEMQAQPPATHLHPDVTQHSSSYNDTPPAYSPPATILQPTVKPHSHYTPAKCQYCDKSFTGKYGAGNLKRHIRQGD